MVSDALKGSRCFSMNVGHVIDRFLSSVVVDSDIRGRAGGGMVTMHQIEGRMSGADVNSIVVGEFCNGQPIDPIILMVIDEEMQVLFQLLIDAFSLTVHLRMIRCGGVVLNAM